MKKFFATAALMLALVGFTFAQTTNPPKKDKEKPKKEAKHHAKKHHPAPKKKG